MDTIIHRLNYSLNFNHFYIKRDDLLPQFYGGNKVRIAKEYFKDMKEKCCDCLVAYGSKNSNMCRVIALMCAEKYIPCFIIYGVDDTEYDGINDFIVRNTGAQILVCQKCNIKETIEKGLRQAVGRGYKPYYIFGNSEGIGNEKIGMEGYVSCYDEIKRYEYNNIFFDYIFVTSGTGITQAGLIAGEIIKDGKEKIVGISVARKRQYQEKYIMFCLQQYFGKLKLQDRNKIEVYDKVLQGGYAHINLENKEFILDFIVRNGIPLDYTYVGKGIWGMMEYLKEKKIFDKNILFVHTGATPIFFENLMNSQNICGRLTN